MRDADCVAFLQWALPRLDLRWQGFRKVHGQVCKRLKRRMKALGLADIAAYRARLEAYPDEWATLDEMCHITISRFFRDSRIFETLALRILPEIAARAAREDCEVRFWTAGCASGEESYTLKIVWDLEVAGKYPGINCSIVATDIDRVMLERAREGCYSRGSLRELPEIFIAKAFDQAGDLYCVKSKHREGVRIVDQDIRSEAPEGLFDLILCRNMAFTYFEPSLQKKVLHRLVEHLSVPGHLAIGAGERLPEDIGGLEPLPGLPEVFRLFPP